MQTVLKKIMTTELEVIPSGTSIQKAWEVMNVGSFRHLPVSDEHGKIIGILSHRDLSLIKNLDSTSVDFIMSKPVIYADQNTPLRSAIFLLLEKKISCLLISNDNDNVVGIVTTDDLLFYLAQVLEDTKERRFSVSSLLDLQTIGEVARQISNAGI